MKHYNSFSGFFIVSYILIQRYRCFAFCKSTNYTGLIAGMSAVMIIFVGSLLVIYVITKGRQKTQNQQSHNLHRQQIIQVRPRYVVEMQELSPRYLQEACLIQRPLPPIYTDSSTESSVSVPTYSTDIDLPPPYSET